MKNNLNINSRRTIKKTFPRFLSLIIMSLLGVAVFVGLLSTSPDMLKSLDDYFDSHNVYDIKLLSSMGLIDDDITELNKIENIKDIEGIYSIDFLLSNGDDEHVVNISSLPEKINTLDLVQGRLPKKDNEIVIEENFIKKTKYKINDTITIQNENLINTELKIVGTVVSPIYFNATNVSQMRGTSSLGTGVVNYYAFVTKTNFNVDYYTNIYISLEGSKEKITSKKDYITIVDKVSKEIEKIQTNQEKNRYDKIYNEALNEITENEQKINTELTEAQLELDKAKKQLNSAAYQLRTSKQQLATFKNELDKGYKELTSGKTEYEKTLQSYSIKEEEIPNNIKLLEEKKKKINYALANLPQTSQEYIVYKEQLSKLNEQLIGLKKLQETKNILDSGFTEYNKNLKLYNSSYKEYEVGLATYNNSLAEYNKTLLEYENGKQEAETKIADAKEQLNNINKPQWYIFDRRDDQTYSTYISQMDSLKNLATIFPLVFYAVAILVSLISMNGMVEDDRGEIGTLKSLGFTNKEIISKYIRFSLTATVIGGLLGILIGLVAIPYLIFVIYGILFVLPKFHFGLNPSAIITGLGIAILCICGATLITALKVLKGKPAELMRPKAPVAGKKILLEKFSFLWHKLKFSNKITIRNIFRYKKRVFVTIVGICGCTALMLCGFGLRDSIVDVTNKQYLETILYDETVYTNDLKMDKVDEIFSNDLIEEYVLADQITVTLNESSLTIIALDSTDFSKVFNTLDHSTSKPKTLQKDSIMITDKLAELHEIEIGDTITVLDGDTKEYKLTVTDIVKNYMEHYIYIDKSNIENYNPNTVFLNTKEKTKKQQEQLTKELLTNDEVINVIHTETLIDSTADMIKSLDLIIAVLVLMSAALSFVVLYNLSNINITERKREIATLKVLGFHDKEVDNYITRENLILTLLGIIPGFLLGYYLTFFTIGTVEAENTRFIRNITMMSYLYSGVISLIFTFIVNFVTHFSLKKIDMIESLKSVE